MTDDPDDENEDTASYVRKQFAKQRGVSDFFDYSDKVVTELEAARTAFEEAGIPIAELRKQPELNHPPDCQAILDQELVGVEVTELVSQAVIEQFKRDRTILWKPWSEERFRRELERIIEKKDQPRDVRGGPYSKYFLVVHTDENALTAEMVRPWLVGFAPKVRLLDEVLLLLSYEPEARRCPLFRIVVQKK